MYSDKKKHKGILIAAGVLFAAVLILLLFLAFRPDLEVRSEGTEAIRNTVQRHARQCYAVEGVYPPNLKYLEENYGLRINQTEYYVIYNAFASNLPPSVQVVAKKSK